MTPTTIRINNDLIIVLSVFSNENQAINDYFVSLEIYIFGGFTIRHIIKCDLRKNYNIRVLQTFFKLLISNWFFQIMKVFMLFVFY